MDFRINSIADKNQIQKGLPFIVVRDLPVRTPAGHKQNIPRQQLNRILPGKTEFTSAAQL